MFWAFVCYENNYPFTVEIYVIGHKKSRSVYIEYKKMKIWTI